MIKELLPVMQLILTTGNIIILAYALLKFLNRPHDTLESRVILLEGTVKDLRSDVLHGSERFKKQDDTNEVFINCMLAFIDFELSYCSHTDYKYTEDLDKAKDTLRKHLARKG